MLEECARLMVDQPTSAYQRPERQSKPGTCSAERVITVLHDWVREFGDPPRVTSRQQHRRQTVRLLVGRAHRVIPSGPNAIIHRFMVDLPNRGPGEFESFARSWSSTLLAVLLRSVRDPSLAYDLGTETLASARLRWNSAPAGEEAVGWLLSLGAEVLRMTVERGSVPSTERRRGRQPRVHHLTREEQREITKLAESHLELPEPARGIADALARSAPTPPALRNIRLSSLIDPEPLPYREESRDGGRA